MEPGVFQNTRKENITKYFVNLSNLSRSAFMYNVEVLTHSDTQNIDWLKNHPGDLKYTIAHMYKEYPFSACGIIVCKDENEFSRLLQIGNDWIVTELWKEEQEINITQQVIAINQIKKDDN